MKFPGTNPMPDPKKAWKKPLVKILSVKKDTFSGTFAIDYEKFGEPDRLRP